MSRHPRPLADALVRLRGDLAPASLLAHVQEAWTEIAGAEIARHSEPVAERGGVITVRCESGVWAAELTAMSATLTERLNAVSAQGRQVREIRFTAAR
jgi:predicted nucleic acid-binding Zn ribbon protein